MGNVNFKGFEWINEWAGHYHFLDIMMLWLSDSVPYAAVSIMIILWFSGRDGQQRFIRRYSALYALFSTVTALTINFLIHLFYYHPRPFVAHHVQQLVPHTADSSFVSDHAVVVFALAWILMLRKEKLGAPVLILAVMVAISRIYLGVHYPLDVIGSAVIALFTGVLLLSLSKRLEPLFDLFIRLYKILFKPISAKRRRKA